MKGNDGYPYPDLVKLLVDRGAVLTFGAAVLVGNDKFVAVALKEDPNLANALIGPVPPLFAAAGLGNSKIVRLLLTKGARVNETTDSGCALHALAWYKKDLERDHLKVAVLLLSVRGIDVNALDKRRHTALYYAERTGSKRIAALLKRRGAVKK